MMSLFRARRISKRGLRPAMACCGGGGGVGAALDRPSTGSIFAADFFTSPGSAGVKQMSATLPQLGAYGAIGGRTLSVRVETGVVGVDAIGLLFLNRDHLVYKFSALAPADLFRN